MMTYSKRDVLPMHALDKYLVKCQADNLSRETIRDKRRHLTVFLTCSSKPLELLDLDELYEVINKASEGKTETVKWKMRRDLRSFFRYLNESGKSDLPYTSIKNLKHSYKLRPRIYNKEYLKLLKACESFKNGLMYRVMIELLYSTGIRVNELVSIKLDDVLIEEKTFMVCGKNKKWRQCFFESDIDEYLRIYCPKDTLIPLTTKSVRFVIGQLCDKAKIRHLSPHSFRHAFCSDLIVKNDPLTVCTLSGHSKVQTIYDHYWHPENLRQAWKNRKKQ